MIQWLDMASWAHQLGSEKGQELGAMLYEDPNLNNDDLWMDMKTRKEAESWLYEYRERKQHIELSVTKAETETLKESKEKLGLIVTDLDPANTKEHSMLGLYLWTIAEELAIRARAEQDPAYREQLLAEREAQARVRKAEIDAREYLAKTAPPKVT